MTRALATLALVAAACSSQPAPVRPAARPHTTRALPPEDRLTTTSEATTTTTAARPRRAVRPTTTAVVAEGNEGAAAQQVAALEAIKRCESGGRYDAVSRSGKHRGAHQWDARTWNGVAARHRPDLVGVDPAAASPADQDAMAGHLYDERGGAPWPNCG